MADSRLLFTGDPLLQGIIKFPLKCLELFLQLFVEEPESLVFSFGGPVSIAMGDGVKLVRFVCVLDSVEFVSREFYILMGDILDVDAGVEVLAGVIIHKPDCYRLYAIY